VGTGGSPELIMVGGSDFDVRAEVAAVGQVWINCWITGMWCIWLLLGRWPIANEWEGRSVKNWVVH